MEMPRQPIGFTEPALWRAVGNTPLLPLNLPAGFGRIYLKAEWLNPGGSVKDRAARAILRDGLCRGELPAKQLLDASSGNTGIAYAMLGAAAGIGVTICLPANASPERRALLEIYGARVELTDRLEGTDGAVERARELAADAPDRFYYADQYSNEANPRAHYETTGPEIWTQRKAV
jgi:S-sulfo-L-cysteine synthase (O-acetyl-L-serine-dependent)